jgi:hypothetical protein
MEDYDMTYRDIKVCISIVVALLLSSGSLHTAMAQGVNSLPDGPVACDAFQRSGYGSWTVLRPATLYPSGVPLSLAAGQTFAPNQILQGFEVTALLDRSCGNS